MIRYHFIFCPRYRRKIFLIDGVEFRFKELVRQICEQHNYDIIALECDKDHCHLFVSALPQESPHNIMKNIKGVTGKVLREEFAILSKMPNLWTRSYYCSTAGDVSAEVIKWHVNNQKTRS